MPRIRGRLDRFVQMHDDRPNRGDAALSKPDRQGEIDALHRQRRPRRPNRNRCTWADSPWGSCPSKASWVDSPRGSRPCAPFLLRLGSIFLASASVASPRGDRREAGAPGSGRSRRIAPVPASRPPRLQRQIHPQTVGDKAHTAEARSWTPHLASPVLSYAVCTMANTAGAWRSTAQAFSRRQPIGTRK
jgi:hypothetical protein